MIRTGITFYYFVLTFNSYVFNPFGDHKRDTQRITPNKLVEIFLKKCFLFGKTATTKNVCKKKQKNIYFGMNTRSPLYTTHYAPAYYITH